MSAPPTPEQLVADLVELLDIAPAGADRFTAPRKKGGVGRVFGGQAIAQALVAAERTVPEDRPVHSLHAYFLRGGSEDHLIDLAVDRALDGGSFSNRRVIASQQGTPILTLSAGFQRVEDGLAHTDAPMPSVPGPDALEPDSAAVAREWDRLPPESRDMVFRHWAIETRTVDRHSLLDTAPQPPYRRWWVRAKAPLDDDPRLHRAVLAYLSDLMFLATCIMPHGLSFARGDLTAASLDHAVWFHAPFRADEWMLFASDSPWSGGGRGFNRGQLFQDGRLIASVAQEGMIRRRRPKP